MSSPRAGYVALATHWNGQWEVFVLDPAQGLLGRTVAAHLTEVEAAARAFLAAHLSTPADRLALTVMRPTTTGPGAPRG